MRKKGDCDALCSVMCVERCEKPITKISHNHDTTPQVCTIEDVLFTQEGKK